MFNNSVGAVLPIVASILCGGAASAANFSATGAFEVSASILVVTAVPAGGQVWCSFDVFSGFDARVFERGNVQAKILSGNVYTCRMSLPFHWDYGSIGTGNPNLSLYPQVNVTIIDVNITNPAAIQQNLGITRSSSHPNPLFAPSTIPLLGNGNLVMPTIVVRI